MYVVGGSAIALSVAMFKRADRAPPPRPDSEAARAANVLAFFDRPGTSNCPTEAINRRLEHLRGSALA